MALALPPYSPTVWKAIIGVGGAVVLLGATLLLFDKCGTYFDDKKTTKLRANVNAAAQELKDAQANKDKDNIDVIVKTERMKAAVNAAVDAANATDAAKMEVARATQNLANAAASNRAVDVSVVEINRQLDNLGIK